MLGVCGVMDYVFLLLEINFVCMYSGFGLNLMLVVVVSWDVLVVELVFVVENYGLVIVCLIGMYWWGLVFMLMLVMLVLYVEWLEWIVV